MDTFFCLSVAWCCITNSVYFISHKGITDILSKYLLDPLEEAFSVAAADIGRDWECLYNNLPFIPYRDLVTRSHDIRGQSFPWQLFQKK